jgi:hypothetical protein
MDFMTVFPPEIIRVIILWLDKMDWDQGRIVCKQWKKKFDQETYRLSNLKPHSPIAIQFSNFLGLKTMIVGHLLSNTQFLSIPSSLKCFEIMWDFDFTTCGFDHLQNLEELSLILDPKSRSLGLLDSISSLTMLTSLKLISSSEDPLDLTNLQIPRWSRLISLHFPLSFFTPQQMEQISTLVNLSTLSIGIYSFEKNLLNFAPLIQLKWLSLSVPGTVTVCLPPNVWACNYFGDTFCHLGLSCALPLRHLKVTGHIGEGTELKWFPYLDTLEILFASDLANLNLKSLRCLTKLCVDTIVSFEKEEDARQTFGELCGSLKELSIGGVKTTNWFTAMKGLQNLKIYLGSEELVRSFVVACVSLSALSHLVLRMPSFLSLECLCSLTMLSRLNIEIPPPTNHFHRLQSEEILFRFQQSFHLDLSGRSNFTFFFWKKKFE